MKHKEIKIALLNEYDENYNEIFDQHLQVAYEEIRRTPSAEKIPNTHRPISFIAVSAVAVIAIMFSINLVDPVLAESIPIIGNLFSAINNAKDYVPFNAEAVDNIALKMVEVTDLSATGSDRGTSLSIKESYYDGQQLYLAAILETDIDPNEEKIDFWTDVTVDGKLIDFDWHFSGMNWIETDKGVYISDSLSTYIPKEYQSDNDKAEIGLTVYMMDYSLADKTGKISNEQSLSTIPLSFTVTRDTSDAIDLKPVDVIKNNAQLISFVSTTAGTEATVIMEDTMRPVQYNVELWDGWSKLIVNSGSTVYATAPYEGLEVTGAGEALPAGVTVVTVRIVETSHISHKSKIIAEFKIDLNTQTIS